MKNSFLEINQETMRKCMAVIFSRGTLDIFATLWLDGFFCFKFLSKIIYIQCFMLFSCDCVYILQQNKLCCNHINKNYSNPIAAVPVGLHYQKLSHMKSLHCSSWSALICLQNVHYYIIKLLCYVLLKI